MSLNWGNYPPPVETRVDYYRGEIDFATGRDILPYGQGRSYGDVCLINHGTLLSTRYWNHFISFDREKGLLKAQAGVSLADILQVIVPAGWFLPVLPGTKFVTLGGAIANDIHGKNHHRHGTFGCWVKEIGLLRSDEGEIICSEKNKSELFNATVGGLGLTGLITWAEIKLVPLQSSMLSVTTTPFHNLTDFFDLNDRAEEQSEYTVAWLDCQASGNKLGRGIFMSADHQKDQSLTVAQSSPKISVPFYAPSFLLNRVSMKAFNAFYFKWHGQKRKSQAHFDKFFFPLDAIGHWNRLYGKPGFLQYQCVIPHIDREKVLSELLTKIVASGQGSFLSVLKTFGEKTSPGLLSFPMSGVTLALDFANKGETTFQLFKTLDEIIVEAGGRIYPAKDARMSAECFKRGYLNWQDFQPFIDKRFGSNFWRRVTKGDVYE